MEHGVIPPPPPPPPPRERERERETLKHNPISSVQVMWFFLLLIDLHGCVMVATRIAYDIPLL